MASFSDSPSLEEYKKRPAGNIFGPVCMTSPWVRSTLMNGEGVPPDAGTSNRSPRSRLPKTIRPSSDQAPPVNVPGTSQMLDTVPCTRSNARSLPKEKKAIDLPSGDQKGEVA